MWFWIVWSIFGLLFMKGVANADHYKGYNNKQSWVVLFFSGPFIWILIIIVIILDLLEDKNDVHNRQ